MNRIKSLKDLQRLPSGNFLNIKTRIVYGKSAIEKEFSEELKELKELKKSKEVVKPKAEVETKAKTKTKNKVKNGK